MVFSKTLPNGLRIIGQKLPYFHSLSIGVWIGTGTVKETLSEGGISHFIEHMLFKGTQTRSAQDIASQMDSIGAQINAFTSKECTCYYIRATEEYLQEAVDMLGDIVLHSAFDKAEMEKEKGVIVEEILMVEDSPEDLALDLLGETFYKGHELGWPILGTKQSVTGFTREDLIRYVDKHYNPANILISCAGNFDEAELVDAVAKAFNIPASGTEQPWPGKPQRNKKSICVREKDIEQAHIALALPGYDSESSGYFPLLILNNAFGGNMSSRLFQKIREEKGLAYSVYSYTFSYRNTGGMGIYAGTNASQAKAVLNLMIEEINLLRKSGLTEEELTRSKNQLKGSYILANESVASRMTSIGKSMLLLGKTHTEEETIAKIEAVTAESVQAILSDVLDTSSMCASIVGKTGMTEDEISKLW